MTPPTFREWGLSHLRIETGRGRVAKFVPNSAQDLLLDTCEGLQGKPGFYPIIKARQLGITTFLLRWLAYRMIHSAGLSCLCVTPNENPTGLEVLTKWRALLAQLTQAPGSGYRGTDYDSVTQTVFRNRSRVAWHHTGGTDSVADSVGRGGSYDVCIITELGFVHESELARRMLEALTPALERSGAPVIIDSTAGALPGAGEAHRDLCFDVIEGRRLGRATFLGWWHYAKRVRDLPLPPDEYRATITPEELALAREHRWSLRQIEWRRKALQPRAGETAGLRRRRFQRAYPESVEAAFESGESKTLWPSDLIEHLQTKGRGRAFAPPCEAPGVMSSRDLMGRAMWGAGVDSIGAGYVRVWIYPDEEEPRGTGRAALGRRRASFFVGVDGADGRPGGDWQTIAILDILGRVAALARLRVDKGRFAAILQRLVETFRAVGIVEAQHGELIHRYVSQSIGPRERQEIESPAKGGHAGEVACLARPCAGLRLAPTTRASRRLYIDALFEVLGDPDACPDPETLREMLTLHRAPDGGKIRARSGAGHHDDLMIALGIAGEARRAYMSAARELPRPRGSSRSRSSRYDYLH